MCEEINSDLEEGKKLAFDLCVHLTNMGAAKAVIPIQLEGQEFLVTVECPVFSAPTTFHQYDSLGHTI